MVPLLVPAEPLARERPWATSPAVRIVPALFAADEPLAAIPSADRPVVTIEPLLVTKELSHAAIPYPRSVSIRPAASLVAMDPWAAAIP